MFMIFAILFFSFGFLCLIIGKDSSIIVGLTLLVISMCCYIYDYKTQKSISYDRLSKKGYGYYEADPVSGETVFKLIEIKD